jgi:hypothetical protein
MNSLFSCVEAFHGILPQFTKSLPRYRLRKSVSKQQPDKQDFHGNLWQDPMEGSHTLFLFIAFLQSTQDT